MKFRHHHPMFTVPFNRRATSLQKPLQTCKKCPCATLALLGKRSYCDAQSICSGGDRTTPPSPNVPLPQKAVVTFGFMEPKCWDNITQGLHWSTKPLLVSPQKVGQLNSGAASTLSCSSCSATSISGYWLFHVLGYREKNLCPHHALWF